MVAPLRGITASVETGDHDNFVPPSPEEDDVRESAENGLPDVSLGDRVLIRAFLEDCECFRHFIEEGAPQSRAALRVPRGGLTDFGFGLRAKVNPVDHVFERSLFSASSQGMAVLGLAS